MEKIAFDIKYRAQIESGEYKVVTREDRPVEIKIWDLKGDFPVVGVYYDEKNNRDTAVQVTAEGRCSIKPDDGYCDDFFILTNKSDLKEFESVVQEIFYKGRENKIELLKITSSVLLKAARKELEKNYHILSKKEYAEFEGDTYTRGYQKGEKNAFRDIPKWQKVAEVHSFDEGISIRNTPDGDVLVLNTDGNKYFLNTNELSKLPRED